MHLSFAERESVAAKIRAARQAIAEQVTDQFFLRHPDWLDRYGERGRRLGIEDAAYHLEFLAGAVECGTSLPFVDYVRWTVSMLGARGIAASFLEETLEQIQAALETRLSNLEQETVAQICGAGRQACFSYSMPAAEVRNTGLQLSRSIFLQAIQRGDRKAALNIIREAIRDGYAIPDIYLEVFQNALYEVGRLWETGHISVAAEHTATATTQYVMAQLYSQIDFPAEVKGRAVVTGVKGELHQVGAHMLADLLEADGWSIRFLGTNMPAEGIVQCVLEHEADVLGISVTMLFNVPEVVSLMKMVRAKCVSRSPRILLGGAAFRFAPELWHEIGADGCAGDLQSGLALFDANRSRR